VAGGVGRDGGGILGLVRLLAEYGEAVEYDLLVLGRSIDDLGTRRLTWRDLLVICAQAPSTSALARAIHGEAAAWGPLEHIAAAMLDALNGGNWQRGGGKGPKPKPTRRPGPDRADRQHFGRDPLPVDEMAEWLGWT
jgi:hypothetical protein